MLGEQELLRIDAILIDCTKTTQQPLLEVQREAGEEIVDVHFSRVIVHRARAEQHRDELIALLNAYPGQRLAQGPSYIEVGTALRSNGEALCLFALGEVLGLWRVITPKGIGIEGQDQADALATQGMVMISGYQPWEAAQRRIVRDDLNDLLEQVRAERQRQDQQWGGPDHDDQHTLVGWRDLIMKHALKATVAAPDIEQRFVKVAALALAAAQSYRRHPFVSIPAPHPVERVEDQGHDVTL